MPNMRWHLTLSAPRTRRNLALRHARIMVEFDLADYVGVILRRFEAATVGRDDLLTAGTRTPMRSRTRRGNPYGNRPGPLTAYRAVVAAARAQSTDGVQVTGWEDVASCVRRLTGTCQEVAKSRYGRDTKVCFSRS